MVLHHVILLMSGKFIFFFIIGNYYLYIMLNLLRNCFLT